MSEIILQAKNIVKSYSDHQAVMDFSLTLRKNEVCGLIGQNGAGKSSILRMLSGIFFPDSGSVEIRTKKKIGYLPEERGLYPNMQVQEHLEFFARLRGLSDKEAKTKAESALNEIGLGDWRKRQVKQLSKGMQQKVQILATILHEPELLILDEPFSGLDPVSLIGICDLIKSLKQKGTSIIISTHQMKVAEEISDQICLLNKGETLWNGSTENLRQYFGKNIFHISFQSPEPMKEINWSKSFGSSMLSVKEIESYFRSNFYIQTFEVEFPQKISLKEIAEGLNEENSVLKIEQYLPSLEESFKRMLAS